MIGIFNKLFQKNTCTKKVVIQTEVTGFAPDYALLHAGLLEYEQSGIK